jgi:transcriptional regulator with XRE-family HTH domain
VKPNIEKLGRFVKKRMLELGLTDRDVEKRSRGMVSYGTVNGITNSKHSDIQLASLYGIAMGIGVPKETLFAVAFGEAPEEKQALLASEEQDLVNHFRQLPLTHQTFILQVVKSLQSTLTNSSPTNLEKPEKHISTAYIPKKRR